MILMICTDHQHPELAGGEWSTLEKVHHGAKELFLRFVC
jgi:hypothetical protein